MIQWYPGHMAKAIREIGEKVKLVDLIIVLLDARIPKSSFNPLLNEVLNNKKILYVLTKKDKADDIMTNKWLNKLTTEEHYAIALDARNNQSVKLVEKSAEELMKSKREKDAKRGLKPRPIRTMVVGIPNVGKSTLINALAKKKVASVGDRPGITKNQQWIRINQYLELLDTPGVLWQKFEDHQTALHLAITGAIKDQILPIEEISVYFIDFLKQYYESNLTSRFQIDSKNSAIHILESIAKKQNNYLISGELDLVKTSNSIIHDFRNDLLGKISLDRCSDE